MTNRVDTSYEPYDRKRDGVLANLPDPDKGMQRTTPRPTGPRKVTRDTQAIINSYPRVRGVERIKKGAHWYTYPGPNRGPEVLNTQALRAR
jgi:hypothetical protein